MLQSQYVNWGRSFTPTTSYTTYKTKNNTHLENKLQLISKQLYPPKTSHSYLLNVVLSDVFQALRGIFSTSKTLPTDLGALEDSPSFNALEVFQHSPCAAQFGPGELWSSSKLQTLSGDFGDFFLGGTQQWRWLAWFFWVCWVEVGVTRDLDLDVIHPNEWNKNPFSICYILDDNFLKQAGSTILVTSNLQLVALIEASKCRRPQQLLTTAVPKLSHFFSTSTKFLVYVFWMCSISGVISEKGRLGKNS